MSHRNGKMIPSQNSQVWPFCSVVSPHTMANVIHNDHPKDPNSPPHTRTPRSLVTDSAPASRA